MSATTRDVYKRQLFEETVFKDICFGPRNMGLSEEEIKERARRAVEFTGLNPELLEKSPFELSGGEKRRAAIAGVIAMDPDVLILDEPTAGLDPVSYTHLDVYKRQEKFQVQEMTRRLLCLKEVPKPDDTADALAMAICHGQAAGSALRRSMLNGGR